jgi:hypothetical protein
MSEENTPTQPEIGPDEEITEEKKIILLNQWKTKVQEEIDSYNVEKDKIMDEYKRIKSRMEKILGFRLQRMKKYDAVINNRKKVLVDIINEIKIANSINDKTNENAGNVDQSGGSGEESPPESISA